MVLLVGSLFHLQGRVCARLLYLVIIYLGIGLIVPPGLLTMLHL